MAWTNAIITYAGVELLRRAMNGKQLIIDSASGGTGTVDASKLAAQTKLVGHKQNLQIPWKADTAEGCKIAISCTSAGLSAGYQLQQIGLWAHIDDEPSILFAIMQDAIGYPIPAYADIPDFALMLYATLAIDNKLSITIQNDPGAIATHQQVEDMGDAIKELLEQHENNANNPHGVTATQIGAATATDLNAHTGNKSNPHGVTKAQIGLDKVDNTADVDKPISTAMQEALDSLQTELGGKAPTSHTHVIGDVGGLSIVITQMRDKIKLNAEGIASAGAKLSDLAGYIGYADADIYGVEVDFVNKRFTRLAGAAGKTAGADFDSINAFGGRRRCNVTNDGYVTAYYGDDTFSTTGRLKASVTTPSGTLYPKRHPVQVMIEQPKFYYKVVPLLIENKAKGGITRKVRYYISDTPKAGFKLHPAFIQNGVEKEKIYLSAFEGSLYDVSAGEAPLYGECHIFDDAQVADFAVDKLCSIAGAKPASGTTQTLSRANARKLAQNRGAGWELSYAATVSASQLLMLIEYASFNMQSAIGMGAVSKADDGSTNMAENTGATISLGNASGAVTNANGIQIVSYRGEENLWGNIWGWVDGMNVQNPSSFTDGDFGTLFVSDHGFTDNSSESPYKNTGIHPCYGNGYTSAFGWSAEFDWMFVPAEKNGNNNLPVGDYYSNVNPDWRAAILGGQWNDTTYAGAFVWSLSHVASNRFRGIGARLVYIPQ